MARRPRGTGTKRVQSYGIRIGLVLIEKSRSGQVWLWDSCGDGVEVKDGIEEKLTAIIKMLIREKR